MFGPSPAPAPTSAPASPGDPPENESEDSAEKENPPQPNFPAPKGFDSHGTKPGGTFNCVAKIEVEEDGTLSVVSLDGVPFKDEDGDPEETATDANDKAGGGPPTSGFLNAANNGMNY